MSPGGDYVLYSSNANDIERRHIYKVSVNGGMPTGEVTTGKEIEWSPVVVNPETIAMLHSGARMSSRVAIHSRAIGTVDLPPRPVPTDVPDARVSAVTFAAADGMPVHGQLFLPPDGASKHPAVVFIHGGSRRQMLLGWHYMFYYHQAYGFNQYLASKGYVVLSINYRSGIGYGLNFRKR